MDPLACYKLMCDSMASREWEAAEDAAINLRRWLMQGGAVPLGDKGSLLMLTHSVRRFARCAADLAERAEHNSDACYTKGVGDVV